MSGRPRRRLDLELVRRGLVPTRAQARQEIEAGRVLVGGAPAERPARLVAPAEPVTLCRPSRRYVGRGGEKLAGALSGLGLDVSGRTAVDAGASTGGFTDCLLQHGAHLVVAVDVGYGQLHERLRADPRVRCLERTNVRNLTSGHLDGLAPDLVVADLAFISLRTVAGALLGICAPGADLVLLVKPQFEAGRSEASRVRGVVTDPEVREAAVAAVAAHYQACGATVVGTITSPLTGADGNVEVFLHVRAPAGAQ